MESIIDRVINELVFRLTSSGRSARAANAGPEQPHIPASPPVLQQQSAVPPTPSPAAPQVQQPTPPPPPEPAPPPEPTEVIVERELQRIVAEARQELDAAVLIVAELRASADGFSERIAATGERLERFVERFDSWLVPMEPPQPQAYAEPSAPLQAPWTQPESAPPPAPAPQAQPAFQAPEPDQFAAEAAIIPTHTVSLTVASLSNLTVVSVVEAALLRIPGVREVALRQLQGRKAVLEVRLDEGTGLIRGLRKSLPLAFDVTESSDHSLEISLSYAGAPSGATNGGGGAGPTLA